MTISARRLLSAGCRCKRLDTIQEIRRERDNLKQHIIELEAARETAPSVDPEPVKPADKDWLLDKLRFVLSHVRHLPKEEVVAALERAIKEVSRRKDPARKQRIKRAGSPRAQQQSTATP